MRKYREGSSFGMGMLGEWRTEYQEWLCSSSRLVKRKEGDQDGINEAMEKRERKSGAQTEQDGGKLQKTESDVRRQEPQIDRAKMSVEISTDNNYAWNSYVPFLCSRNFILKIYILYSLLLIYFDT